MPESVTVFVEMFGPLQRAWLAASVAIFVLSIIAFRRRRRIDTWLLLIGSSAFFAKYLFWDVFMLFLLGDQVEHEGSAFAQIFYPGGHASAPWTSYVAMSLLVVSLLFPVGVVICIVQSLRTRHRSTLQSKIGQV
jgi:hypothetical protein